MAEEKIKKKIGIFDVFGIILLFVILVFPNLQHGAGAVLGSMVVWFLMSYVVLLKRGRKGD